jgi:hypothetical protein
VNVVRADLFQRAEAFAEELSPPSPKFEFVIGWANDYTELFAADREKTTKSSALLDETRRVGRVLLHGEGGTGKSTIAHRLFRDALERETVPLLVDMRKWDPGVTTAWSEGHGNETVRADLLLSLAMPAVSEQELAWTTLGRPVTVIVDGLNEAPAPVPDEILSALDVLARRNPQAGVVVTDRLVRRILPSESWSLARIEEARLPRPATEAPSGGAGLTRMAFFLDLSVREGFDSSSGSEAFRRYFESHANLSEDELGLVARAAYEMYMASASRTFPHSDFSDVAGTDLVDRLETAGILIRSDDSGYFRHHLFHDFLAGLWLARDRRRWKKGILNSLTFGASSFDVLALALEEIADADDADSLLRKIYDWNYYGSAYALAKGRTLGTVAATESMELALLAMLAERRWDPLLATSQRVEDALRLFPEGLAHDFLWAQDFGAVLGLVRAAALDQPFEEWRELFTILPGSTVDDSVVDALSSSESLIGWTTANVLKRVALTGPQRSRVRDYLHRDNETVRWRAAHVLGAVTDRQTVDALFEALEDRDEWVRYGAVRSIVELAAREERLRDKTLERLRRTIHELAADPKVIAEFERAVLLREAPPGWDNAVAPIIEELWGTADSMEAQDHWRQVALRVHRQSALA